MREAEECGPAWTLRPGHLPPAALQAAVARRKRGAQHCCLLPPPWWGGPWPSPWPWGRLGSEVPLPSPALCLYPTFPGLLQAGPWPLRSGTCRAPAVSTLTRSQGLEEAFLLHTVSSAQPSLQTPQSSTRLPSWLLCRVCTGKGLHRFQGEAPPGEGQPRPSQHWREPLLP